MHIVAKKIMRASLVVSHVTIFMLHIFALFIMIFLWTVHTTFLQETVHCLKMMASELSVNKELIRCAFITDLDKRKIYVKFCAPQFA
jgi:hypothetical protein